MLRSNYSILVVAVLLISSTQLFAEEHTDPDVLQFAGEIDRLIAEHWVQAQVTPAPLSDDAEFLRRVYLDITGKIPPAAEVRDFIANQAVDKRSEAVAKLLQSPAYIIHYTNLWRAAMVPEADADQAIRIALPGFEAWLRSRIAENRNFAEIVSEMLTLPVNANDVIGFNQPDSPTPVAFYRAKQGKPELLAAATARLFLGVRIDCAQCHDHPFDDWKQPQFWQHAAFFTDVDVPTGEDNPVPASLKSKIGKIKIPERSTIVSATFLDGNSPELKDKNPRELLANWIVSADNPYFAKAAVNRIWSYHFGIGLVEPMDDFSSHNPASHPELLNLLAEEFVKHDYDFKFMIRAITASATYQLTSQQTDASQSRHSAFAKAAVRGLTPEQIFDSIAQATGYRQPFDPEQPLNFNNDQARQEFLATFSNQSESATDRSSTILQALSFMNGSFVANATDITDSKTLAAIIDAPFLDTQEKIESMFLTTLNRLPSATEAERFQRYVESGGPRQDSKTALGDVFWVLLNSSEFLLNH